MSCDFKSYILSIVLIIFQGYFKQQVFPAQKMSYLCFYAQLGWLLKRRILCEPWLYSVSHLRQEKALSALCPVIFLLWVTLRLSHFVQMLRENKSWLPYLWSCPFPIQWKRVREFFHYCTVVSLKSHRDGIACKKSKDPKDRCEEVSYSVFDFLEPNHHIPKSKAIAKVHY